MKKEENQINNLPEEWNSEPFVDTIEEFRIERTKQIQANVYLSNGKYPVIDQGQEIIAGWTNDESAIINEGLPLIVFGDHTRIFKYIDFPFAIGADGTKLIKPQNRFDARYFYYYLLSLNIPSKGYSRHYKTLKEKDISYPSLSEQQKIAAVLSKIQKAIEIQESIIKTTQELKKSTMQHLFTHGLYGEKTKQTEIGEIPERWEVGTLKDLCDIVNNTCQPKDNSSLVYVGLEHIDTGSFFLNRFGSPNEVVSSKNKFTKNDVLYGKLRPYLDKAVVADSDGMCSTDILVFRPKKDIPPLFLLGILHYSHFIDYAIQTTHGVNHPRTSWKSLQFYKLGIPLIKEQQKIGDTLNIIEQKIATHMSKRTRLQELFNSMLNKLMIGEICVKDINIITSNIEFGGIDYDF